MSGPAAGNDDTGPVPGERLLRAWRTWLPFAGAIGVLAIVASVVVSLAATAPSPQSALCPPAGEWPTVGIGPPVFTDNNIAVFVGGDLVAAGANLESEGLLVVRGDASFGAAGAAGVAMVGATRAGTGVAPTPGTTMLAVGRDLSIDPDAALEFGIHSGDGGNLVVGGSISPGAVVVTHGGRVHEGVGSDAVAEFERFGDTLDARSQQLGALPVTGATTSAGRTLYFAGDARSPVQAFAVDARALGRAAVIDFTGIPEGAVVVVTVAGESVALGTGQVADAGVRVVPGPGSTRVAERTLWNFIDARSVTITGTAPVLGSVLVPKGRASVGAPTVGRLYVGGDLLLAGTTARPEPARHSNVAWPGAAAFACQPVREVVQ